MREARGAIVLAAGLGRRMGRPKALLEIGGRTLAQAHATELAPFARRVVVVAPPSLTRDDLRLPRAAELVASSADDPAGSLAVALSALDPAPEDVVLVTPVDMIPVATRTIERVLEALGPDVDAATPLFGDAGGHPVAVRARVLLAPGGATLRDRLRALGERRRRVAVDDPRVLGDLDTPADARAVQSS